MNIQKPKIICFLLIMLSCFFTTVMAMSNAPQQQMATEIPGAITPQQQMITEIYISLGVTPNPTDLAHWDSFFSANVTTPIESLSMSLANSLTASNYSASFQGLNSDGIVAKIYKNLFCSPPLPSALSYWSLKLANGSLTFSQVIL